MSIDKRYSAFMHLAELRGILFALMVMVLFFPSISKLELDTEKTYSLFINGNLVGSTPYRQDIENALARSRRAMGTGFDNILLLDADIEVRAEEEMVSQAPDMEDFTAAVKNALAESETSEVIRGCTLRIGQYTAELPTEEDVVTVLDKALKKYDPTGKFHVELVRDYSRQFNVLTVNIISDDTQTENTKIGPHSEAGVWQFLTEAVNGAYEISPDEEDFEDFTYGLVEMEFMDKVEVIENVISPEYLQSADAVAADLTKEEEVPTIYEVVAGDTLSAIAWANDLSIDQLLAMNPMLEDENSMIRIGDNITIMQPEPELSIIRKEQLFVEEDYDEPIQYKDNDEWYTNQTVTLIEPSAGHRKAVTIVSYKNDDVTGREVVKEEIQLQAVAKLVERGTKIPPTFIRPVSIGNITSGYGRRNSPTRGASSNHQAIDYGVPIGTSIVASSGGTVTHAGWASGLGYSVTIKHPNGIETVYGHMSRVTCSSGQVVRQGERIGLSGNTGISTGPHLHFAMRVGGTPVNPLNYM